MFKFLDKKIDHLAANLYEKKVKSENIMKVVNFYIKSMCMFLGLACITAYFNIWLWTTIYIIFVLFIIGIILVNNAVFYKLKNAEILAKNLEKTLVPILQKMTQRSNDFDGKIFISENGKIKETTLEELDKIKGVKNHADN